MGEKDENIEIHKPINTLVLLGVWTKLFICAWCIKSFA